MNERIEELAEQAGFTKDKFGLYWDDDSNAEGVDLEKFADLLIKKTLDEVAYRAYYSGDRAWSDDVDRQWVELKFGLGPLSKVAK